MEKRSVEWVGVRLMRVARWIDAAGSARAGRVEGDLLVPMAAPGCAPDDAVGLVTSAAATDAGEPLSAQQITLTTPCPVPPSIRDFMAFEEHVRTARRRRDLEMLEDWYELPCFYFTNPAVVRGPDDAVTLPATRALDYELEVAAVIGASGSDLTVAEAAEAICAYTIFNDWSARDLQAREMALGLGPAKGKDFAQSIGPVLATPDELGGEPGMPSAGMRARVNGRAYSEGELASMHHSFAELVAYASRDSRVVPGDIIGSGTVGRGCILELSYHYGGVRFPWLAPDDVVELEVDGIGVLRNTVVSRG